MSWYHSLIKCIYVALLCVKILSHQILSRSNDVEMAAIFGVFVDCPLYRETFSRLSTLKL